MSGTLWLGLETLAARLAQAGFWHALCCLCRHKAVLIDCARNATTLLMLLCACVPRAGCSVVGGSCLASQHQFQPP